MERLNSHFLRNFFRREIQMFGGAAMTKVNANEMIEAMRNMENGERVKFLEYLFHNHFDNRRKDDMNVATKNRIKDYIDRNLTEEETLIMKLAYEIGHNVGCKDGAEKVLKGERLS